MSSGSLLAQIFVSVTGIAIMTHRRLLHFLVETAGQAAAQAGGGQGRLIEAA